MTLGVFSPASLSSDTIVSAGPILVLLQPYLLSALGAAATALIAWGAATLQRWTGIRIDQAHREALHSAATTGVNMALSKLDVAAAGLTFDTRSAIVAEAVAWMERSVPAALAHFRMTPDRLADFVEAKLGQRIALMPSVAAIPGETGMAR